MNSHDAHPKTDLTDAQLEHYSRHILLDPIDIDGQVKLMNSHILVVGCGGLGATVIPLLAAAGVGQLSIVDSDVIERSNLQRQLSYRMADIDLPKVQVMADWIHALNPDVAVRAVNQRVDEHNLAELISQSTVDVLIDCTDNFSTRHVLNRASFCEKIPLVSGAAVRFDGQLALYDPRDANSPCYACAFPEQAQVSDGACATLGIFSPVVVIIGAAQASLALRLALELPNLPVGVLQTFNALQDEWLSFQLSKNPQCLVCVAGK